MSFEVGKKALDFLVANSGSRRNLEVDFFGGEPTMNFEGVKQLVEYGIDIIPDEFGEKETLRKAVQMIKYRDKVLDLVLRLESGEIENYASHR